MSENGRTVRGFMCKADFDFELGEADGGNRIYPSLKDLKDHAKWWEHDGVVEVEVRVIAIVEPERFP